MNLSLDTVALAAPDVHRARAFYTAALSLDVADQEDPAGSETRETAPFALSANDALAAEAGVGSTTSGFRGYVLTCGVDQPTEVRTLMDAAARSGAETLKPAKRALFGSFSGSFRAPDGAVWKLAAGTNKDTGPPAAAPRPVETTAILGVAAPKKSKVFYEALGMTVDRDYGNKYIDFRPTADAARLCLMGRAVLAKDAGTSHDGSGFPGLVLTHRAASRGDVETLLEAAATAGGRITAAAGETGHGYSGCFADPDGFLWRVAH
ncbi:VOC family protein [Streptomyces profundus]|uniref:VOC family protein n=1 Tax=Streptomyces profundus TaxID=2867410 RepID=UPI001D166517|nr:VOC family protein [Streptomyces sp. MA3_2.13]UED84254.1 VOC family protein [Streptomyces sp. MA3_2.13]